ncbi:MAG: hypothetical protein JOZ93_15865 [Sinobacteraceae bacterium]|nr:hypothetical protein [Nevskiaceae bacterium]
MVAAGTLAAYLLRRKPLSPQEVERQRREYLNLHGRIIDGTILDFHEVPDPCDPNAAPAQLLTFTYEIGGVQYEAAQDVTDLRQFVNVHECRLGLPTSVRYDPLRPQNSMVVSEHWIGLRSGTVVPRGTHMTGIAREQKLSAFAQTR